MQNIHNQAYAALPIRKSASALRRARRPDGLGPSDYGQPMTQAYNLTVDQRLPWNSQLEVAYVGSKTSQLVDGGEDISGSSYTNLTDQNKTPIGALFAADPSDRRYSATNPENVSRESECRGLSETATGNSLRGLPPVGSCIRHQRSLTSLRTPHMQTTTAFRWHGSRPQAT